MSRLIIKLVKSKPSLWDPNHRNYLQHNKSKRIWCELANKIQIPVKELKAKWTYLRQTYSRTLSCRKNHPKFNWYLKEDMSFLKNVIKKRKAILSRPKSAKNLSKCQTNDEITEDFVNQIKNNEDDIIIINEPSIDDSTNICNYNSQSPVHSTTTLSLVNDQTEFEKHNNNELIINCVDTSPTFVKPLERSRSLCELNDQIGAANVNQYLQFESPQHQQQQEQPNSDSLFFESIEMDFIKLPIKMKRKFKTNVMKLLNELLDETDAENGNFESTL